MFIILVRHNIHIKKKKKVAQKEDKLEEKLGKVQKIKYELSEV
jgi:hypothetical protein